MKRKNNYLKKKYFNKNLIFLYYFNFFFFFNNFKFYNIKTIINLFNLRIKKKKIHFKNLIFFYFLFSKKILFWYIYLFFNIMKTELFLILKRKCI